MAKASWITAYRSVRDQDALAAYGKLAVPALRAAGARLLARGLPARVYENGLEERTVLIEFDSVAQAIAAHDSPGYQEAPPHNMRGLMGTGELWVPSSSGLVYVAPVLVAHYVEVHRYLHPQEFMDAVVALQAPLTPDNRWREP